MKPTLPVYLNFAQKAKNGFEIQGKWPIKQLKRLGESLLSDQGEIEVELRFDRAGPIPYIVGHITAELELKCQRCMQPVQHVVDAHFKLGMVQNDEQMERLPDEYEPYLLEDDNNHLPDMLEDELLLSLPLVAMHDYDCSEYLKQQADEQPEEVVTETAAKKENPFAALKDLL